MKGLEIELLYKFAKAKNYNIKMTPISDVEDRITYIEQGTADITGGYFTISDERKEKVDFSDSFYSDETVLVVRKDSKKDEIAIKVLDDKNSPKKDNTADILVKFPKKETTSSCVFPEKYNETITIKCTISDLKDIDPYNEGFEYVNSSDKISVTYSKSDVDSLIKANSKLQGQTIITESDKSKKVCNGTAPPPTPSSTPLPSPEPFPSDDNKTLYYQNKKSSTGLSTGGIIGIAIPCGLVVLTAAGFALMGSGAAPAAAAPQFNNSELLTVTRQNLPLNAYEIQQPVQVVQPVQGQAVQPVTVVQDVNVVP
jgi:polar amino acid transport system substrate-binding protein